MKNNQILLTVVIALVLAGGGFFAGMKYQQDKNPFASGQLQAKFHRQNDRAGFNGLKPVTGEITSVDDKSITVKMQDGSSKIVILPDGVTISRTENGSKADLKQGVRVGVFGTENPDGSVTAQNIQLNPIFKMIQNGATSSSSAR